MVIYKVINKINGKWYIGKDAANRSYYYGSGVAISNAIKKYGKDNFVKVILEECVNKAQLIEREKYWITATNAVNDPMSYNLAPGGEGGDLSKYINYSKRELPNNNFKQAHQWYNSLSQEEKSELHRAQGEKRTKGWYVSRIGDDSACEEYVQNISKWCEEHGIDKSMPSSLNDPKSRLFQKQTKGWRIRRSDMPELPEYIDKRTIGHENIACKGKTWKLIDGKRIWVDK